MAPNKLVGLKYAGVVNVKKVNTNNQNEITSVEVEFIKDCK